VISKDFFQKVYSEIEQYLPIGWEKVVIYLEYGEASYSFSFYVKINETYVKCYDLKNVSESQLFKSFEKINKITEPERKNLDETWSNSTIVVDCNGKMHADFDYTDLSAGTYQFKKEWRKKYLQ